MSDFDHRLIDVLEKSRQPPDESFVSKVTHSVDAYESARKVHLGILSVVALYLAGTLGYGMYLSWKSSYAESIAMASWATVCVSSLALVAIASFVLRPRTRSRE